MRKLFTLSVIALSFSSLHAQIKKGSVFLGGDFSVGMLNTKVGDSTYNQQNVFEISPAIGKATRDNLVVGGFLNLNFYENNYQNTYPDQKNYSYGGGVFLRKYRSIGKSGLYIFLHGSLGYSYLRSKQGSLPFWTPSLDTKQSSVSLSAFPGLSYAITKKLYLEAGFNRLVTVNYVHEKKTEAGTTPVTYKTNSVYLASSLDNLSNLFVGFRLLIGN